MISSILKKLEYRTPPSFDKYEKYRSYIQISSDYRCTYCSITESESPGATFQIDHFRPVKYFPQLEIDCNNLRYSCPRCNSYKRANWISLEQGCIKDCESCHSKSCNENIRRFINCLEEEPSNMFSINEKDEIVVENNSIPAEYTIKILRLNRAQLIKLRHIRRFLGVWESELQQKKDALIQRKSEIKVQHDSYNAKVLKTDIIFGSKESCYQETISTLFELLEIQAQQSIDLIEYEISKLNHLQHNRVNEETVVMCN